MSGLHTALAWVVVVTGLVTGAWAVGAHWKEQWRSSLLIPAIYASWVVVVLQVTLGVVVLQSGVEAGQLHYFYGFLAMAAVAIIYSYRPQVPQWEFLLFGGGNLFIMGLALRSIFL